MDLRPRYQIARSIIAIIVGYALFVVGTWIAQEAILGGVSYHEDDLRILALAGVLTPIAAVLGAFATAAIAGSRALLHVLPMCVLIAIETAYLYSAGRVDGPLWFEIAAAGSLIVGALAGALGWSLLRTRRLRRQEA